MVNDSEGSCCDLFEVITRNISEELRRTTEKLKITYVQPRFRKEHFSNTAIATSSLPCALYLGIRWR
jgi:hypothetical protein